MTTKRTRLSKILGRDHFKKAAQREDGLITYEPSSDTVLSIQRQTEREAFEVAGGSVVTAPAPPSEGRYDYTIGKTCSHCKRFRKFEYFGTKRVRKVVYTQSWCKFCCAEWAAEQRRQSALSILG